MVKGQAEPVTIYELWEPSIYGEQAAHCKEIYEGALEKYFEEDWSAALAGFEASLEHEPSVAFAPTTPSVGLAARCREFLEAGGSEDWDGAYKMGNK